MRPLEIWYDCATGPTFAKKADFCAAVAATTGSAGVRSYWYRLYLRMIEITVVA